MRIAVCDDQHHFREEIKDYLSRYYNDLDTTIACFDSGEALLEYYTKGRPRFHIIILDIEMGELDGMTLAQVIRKADAQVAIIFMTSHLELATDGYEVGALRFLLKPVNEEKLIGAIEVAKKQLSREKVLCIYQEDQELMIRSSEIYCVEAANKEVMIHTAKEAYKHRMNMGEVEKQLGGDTFFRTHRSYLVNLECVKAHDHQTIYLDNGQQIFLSRSKAKAFKEQLMAYIRKNAW